MESLRSYEEFTVASTSLNTRAWGPKSRQDIVFDGQSVLQVSRGVQTEDIMRPQCSKDYSKDLITLTSNPKSYQHLDAVYVY